MRSMTILGRIKNVRKSSIACQCDHADNTKSSFAIGNEQLVMSNCLCGGAAENIVAPSLGGGLGRGFSLKSLSEGKSSLSMQNAECIMQNYLCSKAAGNVVAPSPRGSEKADGWSEANPVSECEVTTAVGEGTTAASAKLFQDRVGEGVELQQESRLALPIRQQERLENTAASNKPVMLNLFQHLTNGEKRQNSISNEQLVMSGAMQNSQFIMHNCHAELVSASEQCGNKAKFINGKILKQVQDDNYSEEKSSQKSILPRPLRERVGVRGINESSSTQHCKNRINSAFKKVKAAFTIAEVIIALVIVGVVAAFVVPSIIHNSQSNVNATKYDVVKYKMRQAMDMMRVNGDLEQFNTTDDFVDSLKKYLKINKVCPSSNIEECWPTDKVRTSDGKNYTVKDAKYRANLGFNSEDNGNNPNVGLVLADGTQMIVTYNPNQEGLPTGDMEHDSMLGLAFVVDVNGSRGPNKEMQNGKYFDIYGYNEATFSEYCNGFYENTICKEADECNTYISEKTCQSSKDGCSGFIDSETRLCITDTDKIASTCAYVDDGKECHKSSSDCTDGFVENGKCNTKLSDCDGYITADRKCDTDVSDCETYIENNVCQTSKVGCDGYIDPETKKCKETATCAAGYVDKIEKKCESFSKCSGYIEDLECITNKSMCDGYINGAKACVDTDTCTIGYVNTETKECLASTKCDTYVDNFECKDSIAGCNGYIDEDKYCQETKTCSIGYVDTTTKECIAKKDCNNGNGYVSDYKCIADASECSGYVENYECNTNKLSCDGYIEDSRCKTCNSGTYTNSDRSSCSACTNAKDYLTDGVCYTCASNQVKNSSGNGCTTSCASNEVINTAGNQCIASSTCSLKNSSGTQCVTSCASGEIKNTAGNQCIAEASCTLKNNSGNQCTTSCPSGEIKNSDGTQCIAEASCNLKNSSGDQCTTSCPNGEVKNTEGTQCIASSSCGTGSCINESTNQCISTSSFANYSYTDSNKICHAASDCSASNQCVSDGACGTIASGYYKASDYKCYAAGTCTTGYVSNYQCLDKTSCTGFVSNYECHTATTDCTNLGTNRYVNSDKTCATCASGNYIDGTSCLSTSSCTTGYVSNYKCLATNTCTNGYVSNYQCIAASNCTGFVSNYQCHTAASDCTKLGANYYVTADKTCTTCASGSYVDGTQCKTASNCTNGYVSNYQCKTANTCTTGYVSNYQCIAKDNCSGFVSNYTCHTATSDCTNIGNNYYVTSDKTCTTCASGSYVDGNQCKTATNCTNGYVEDYRCVAASGCTGSKCINPSTKLCVATSNFSNYAYTDDNRVCHVASDCTGQGNNYYVTSSNTCTTCASGSYIDGNQCKTASNCTNGYVEDYTCKSKSSCTIGYVSNYTCLAAKTCTDQGGTVTNNECQLGPDSKTACDNVTVPSGAKKTYIESVDKCFVELSGDYEWGYAQEACSNLGNGWGLPPQESETDVSTGSLKYICSNYKETLGISSGDFWSSTPRNNGATYDSWIVSFNNCSATDYYRSYSYKYALCVYSP